ncbi:MAG: hypothetical protein DHS20C14_17610 [Phycisphaeraceae bacterium]|nr:MAG: hypothetical protein DHS20C14_17610 [Phycisphaeraceae bacterium]
MTEPADRTLTQRCKDENWDLHQIAERNDGLALVLKGQLEREAYVDILEQVWVGARAMDDAARSALGARPELGAIVLDEQMLAGYAAEDIVFFGRTTDAVEPRPGTARFVAHVRERASDPLYILGLHYVRLGACNGNRFVAMKARQHYALPETGEGTRFLDPFGKAQREGWTAFKEGLDGFGLDAGERGRVLVGVRAMYEYAINMGNDERHVPAAELLEIHAGTLDKDAFTKSHTVVADKTAPAPGDVPLNLTEAS